MDHSPVTEKSKTNQEQYTGFYYQEDYSKDVDYTWDNDKYEINEFNTEINWIIFKQQFFSTIIRNHLKIIILTMEQNLKL